MSYPKVCKDIFLLWYSNNSQIIDNGHFGYIKKLKKQLPTPISLFSFFCFFMQLSVKF
jgi:hypothetical protein